MGPSGRAPVMVPGDGGRGEGPQEEPEEEQEVGLDRRGGAGAGGIRGPQGRGREAVMRGGDGPVREGAGDGARGWWTGGGTAGGTGGGTGGRTGPDAGGRLAPTAAVAPDRDHSPNA